MREIKFRAWDKKINVMFKNWEFIGDFFTNTNFQKTNNILLQYTGLKDRNWVEIYEGDVVELYQKAHGYIKTKIVFKNWWFELRALDSNRIWMFWDIITQNEISMEIIGNIYSNPELINNQ